GVGRNLLAFGVDHARLVARHRLAGRARANLAFGRADEDVQHFGRADAVEDLDAGGGEPGVERRLGQGFAGRPAFAQRRAVGRGGVWGGGGLGRRAGGAGGGVKGRVGRTWGGAASGWGGDVFWRRTDAARPRGENKTSPPSPKVKASGGEPMKRSCASAHSTW